MLGVDSLRSNLFHIYKLIVLVAAIGCAFAKTVAVNADEIADIGGGNLVASGHVVAVYQGMTMNARALYYSKKTQYLTTTGSVAVTYKDRRWKSSSVEYWITPDRMVIRHFTASTDLSSVARMLYVSADLVEKNHADYHGGRVQLTACPHLPPHYTFNADAFELYPDDQIIGHEVSLKVGGIPVFYSPYYAFVQGYKHPILLLPVVGSSLGEGAYMKETLVYEWSADLRSRTFVDLMEKKGIGIGSKLFYGETGRLPGSVYGYYIGPNDHAFDLTQHYKENAVSSWMVGVSDRHLNQPNRFREDETKWRIARQDGNSRWSVLARDQGSYQQAQLEYKDTQPLEAQDWAFTSERYPFSSYQSQTIRQHLVRQNAEEMMTWRDTGYSGSQQQQWQDIGSVQLDKFSRFDWDLLYKRQNLSIGDESTVYPRIIYSVRPTQDPSLEEWALRMNTEVDLDGNRVTWDERVDLVEVMPEISLKGRSRPLAGGLWQVSVEAANIHERHDTGTIWNVQTQKLAAHNKWSMDLLRNPNQRLSYEGLYDQFLYGSGDKQYALSHRWTLSMGVLSGGLLSCWTYQQKTRGGYTPFYFDDVRTGEDRIGHQLLWPLDSALLLSVDDGYNVSNARFEDETIRLKWLTTKLLQKDSISAQVLWSRDPQNGQSKTLQASWLWQESAARNLSFALDHDLSTARTRAAWVKGDWRTQESEPWVIGAMIRWSAERQGIFADKVRIARDLGCMEYAYEWDGASQDHRFVVQIMGIPNGNLGVSAGDSGVGIWGPGEHDAIR